MDNNNDRGQFRRMTMEDLIAKAGLPIWQKREETKLVYQLPVGFLGKREVKKIKPLVKGIPQERLRTIGPFLTTGSPDTHIGPYLHAIDFLVPDGSVVLAG
jgi:hypothetical protein